MKDHTFISYPPETTLKRITLKIKNYKDQKKGRANNRKREKATHFLKKADRKVLINFIEKDKAWLGTPNSKPANTSTSEG